MILTTFIFSCGLVVSWSFLGRFHASFVLEDYFFLFPCSNLFHSIPVLTVFIFFLFFFFNPSPCLAQTKLGEEKERGRYCRRGDGVCSLPTWPLEYHRVRSGTWTEGGWRNMHLPEEGGIGDRGGGGSQSPLVVEVHFSLSLAVREMGTQVNLFQGFLFFSFP